LVWNALLVHGVFERPIPHPLATFTVVVVGLSLYMIYFTTVFPTCDGVPSVAIDKSAPAASWNFLLCSLAKALAALAVLVLVSSSLAYGAGVLPVDCSSF